MKNVKTSLLKCISVKLSYTTGPLVDIYKWYPREPFSVVGTHYNGNVVYSDIDTGLRETG